jgi:two-component system LytT family response regulator
MIVEKASLLRIFVSGLFRKDKPQSQPIINQRVQQPESIMIKALLIISDAETSQLAYNTLAAQCAHVDICGKFDAIKTGVAAINAQQPDLLILDVQLADGSGFDLLNHFGAPDFKIIMISSYMEYAVKAIKYNAVDYLLKPLDAEELVIAVNKASDQISREEKLQFKQLADTFKSFNKVEKISLKTTDQLYVVNLSDIVHIEADGNYTTFYLINGRKVLVSKSMRDFEDSLIEKGFFRIHKSFLINLNQISHFDKKDGGFVIMNNGMEVPVASRKREMLLELISEMG